MSGGIENNHFVTTITSLNLKTQHLSSNLTAKAKPGFLDRFFDWITGAHKEEKAAVVSRVDSFITENAAALRGWKQASPEEFAVFQRKVELLGGKLQRGPVQLGEETIASKIKSLPLPVSPVRVQRAAVTVIKPVVQSKSVVPAVAAPVKAAENVAPNQQVTREQVIASIGQAYDKLLGEFGLKVMKRVVAHYVKTPAAGNKITELMVRQYITNSALTKFKKMENYNQYITTYGTDSSELLAKRFSREILEGRNIDADQAVQYLIALAKAKVGQPLMKELVAAYGQKIADLIIVNYLAVILQGGKISVKSTQTFACERILDIFGRDLHNRLVLDYGKEIVGHIVVGFTQRIMEGKSVTEKMARDRINDLLVKFVTNAEIDIKLFGNYGSAVLSHVVKRFQPEILANRKVAEVDIYAVANTYLLDELIAKNLGSHTSLEEAFRQVILGGKVIPGHTMKAFRKGEFIFTNGVALQSYTGA